MKDEEFGDFEEIKDEKEIPNSENPQQFPARARLPRNNEKLGIVVQRLGANRMEIRCSDEKSRNCRVPGRFKRRFWLRPGDIVLVLPWEFDDLKADIIYQYRSNEIIQLKKRNLLNNLKNEF